MQLAEEIPAALYLQDATFKTFHDQVHQRDEVWEAESLAPAKGSTSPWCQRPEPLAVPRHRRVNG